MKLTSEAGSDSPLRVGSYHWEIVRQAKVGPVTLTRLRSEGARPTTAHSHQCGYLQLVLGGHWTYHFEDDHQAVEPWQTSYHPPGEVHWNEATRGEAQTFEIELSDALIERVRDFGLFDVTARHLSKSRDAARAMARLERELDDSDRWSAIAVEGLVLEVISALGRSGGLPTVGARPPWLSRLEDYLRTDISLSTPLSEIADWLGAHPSAVSREFRRWHGITPSEYVRRQRVRQAADEIANSDVPLSRVALSHGFSDQSHLTRVFRQYMGATPKVFRLRSRPGSGKPVELRPAPIGQSSGEPAQRQLGAAGSFRRAVGV